MFEQLRQDHAANRVHGVECNTELASLDCLNIHERKVFHQIDVLLVVAVVLTVLAEVIYIGILEVFSSGDAQHFSTFSSIQEFAVAVQQLQGVPLTGIVRSGQDNTATSAFHRHGQLCGRGGGKTDVHDIEAHAHERTANNVLHHLARDTCIASNDNLVGADFVGLADQRSIS